MAVAKIVYKYYMVNDFNNVLSTCFLTHVTNWMHIVLHHVFIRE